MSFDKKHVNWIMPERRLWAPQRPRFLMSPPMLGIVGGGARGYQTGAVNLDGVNDYLRASTSFTTSTDSQKFSWHMWLKLSTASDGNAVDFYNGRSGGNSQPLFRKTNADIIHIEFVDGSNSTAFNIESTMTVTSTMGWVSVGFGVDNTSTTTGSFRLFINGSTTWSSTSALIGTNSIDWTSTGTHTLFASNAAGNLYAGDVADVYLETVSAVLANSSGIGLFRSTATGKPLSLGANGSGPTGAQPVMFLKHTPGSTPADFDDNLGYGGPVPITGALTESTSSPTD